MVPTNETSSTHVVFGLELKKKMDALRIEADLLLETAQLSLVIDSRVGEQELKPGANCRRGNWKDFCGFGFVMLVGL